jgi:hypothetical protein
MPCPTGSPCLFRGGRHGRFHGALRVALILGAGASCPLPRFPDAPFPPWSPLCAIVGFVVETTCLFVYFVCFHFDGFKKRGLIHNNGRVIQSKT